MQPDVECFDTQFVGWNVLILSLWEKIYCTSSISQNRTVDNTSMQLCTICILVAMVTKFGIHVNVQ